VATSCSICGEKLQSEGAAGLHELVAHLNPQPPPPLPPPPGSARQRWESPGMPKVRRRRKASLGTGLTLAAVIIAAGLGRMAVRELFDSDRASLPAQEVASAQEVAGAGSARAGFHTVSEPDKGFSIDLPESMDEVPMTAEGLTANVELLKSLNPTLAGVLEGNDALLDQVRLLAIDRVSATTQLVQKVKVGRGADVDDIPRGTFSDQYREYGAIADEAVVRLPAGKALLVSAQLPMGGSSVSVTQYVLARSGYAWILTTSGPNSGKDGAEIASTFRFV
jgi:hypothetical protein